ncbi:hypothetical protein STEG23_005035, partial [Scotinomys teguina]
LYLSLCTRLKSKWIKDLNRKQDTLKLIEEKVDEQKNHPDPQIKQETAGAFVFNGKDVYPRYEFGPDQLPKKQLKRN